MSLLTVIFLDEIALKGHSLFPLNMFLILRLIKVSYFLSLNRIVFLITNAASSAEIREALNHEDLKKLIYNIDCSADAETVSYIFFVHLI